MEEGGRSPRVCLSRDTSTWWVNGPGVYSQEEKAEPSPLVLLAELETLNERDGGAETATASVCGQRGELETL